VFTDVSAGIGHTCGVHETGTVVCWGCETMVDPVGQCGAPEGTFREVAAGRSHSVGLRDDGTLACWGCQWAESS